MIPNAFIFILLSIICSVRTQSGNDSTQNVQNAFMQAHVVPDVLASFNPMATLDVVFTDMTSMQQLNVTPGMNLTMTQTALEPQFFLHSNNTTVLNQTFVLAIVDPDAPTPQNTSISQFRHLLGGDFQVNGTMLMNTSAALSDFVPPTPPAGSDPHRYVVLLYVQPSGFDGNAGTFVNSTTPRNNFNISTFAMATHLGNPIAGNFFLTGPGNSTNSSSAAQPSGTSPSGGAPSSAAEVITHGKLAPLSAALVVLTTMLFYIG